MIAQLAGTLALRGLDAVVVDVGGVGFSVAISLHTLSSLPQTGQPVRLLTHMVVREDALLLYGFATEDEREAFQLCVSVSGVGPKLALAALSGLDPAGLALAIRQGDVARLQRIPGIGKKTAERLVVELRDKFHAPSREAREGARGAAAGAAAGPGAGASAALRADVVTALCNLGYKAADAERATDQAQRDEPSAPIEQVLRRALRALQRD